MKLVVIHFESIDKLGFLRAPSLCQHTTEVASGSQIIGLQQRITRFRQLMYIEYVAWADRYRPGVS